MPRLSRQPPSPDRRPGRCRVKLLTLGDIKSEMGRLYRSGRAGNLPLESMTKLASVLAIMARLIEGSELEKRVEQIEASHEREPYR